MLFDDKPFMHKMFCVVEIFRQTDRDRVIYGGRGRKKTGKDVLQGTGTEENVTEWNLSQRMKSQPKNELFHCQEVFMADANGESNHYEK